MQTRTDENSLTSRAAEVRKLTEEAAQFHADAEAARQNVETGALVALEKAWECGKRLNSIKSILGHGHWLPWLQTNYGKKGERTAQIYMRLARDNPNAVTVRELGCDSLRKHMLTYVPDKEQPNKSKDIKFPRSISFLNIVNEYNRLKYRHMNGLQRVDFEEAKAETAELQLFLSYLNPIACDHCGAVTQPSNPWSATEKGRPPRR